MMYDTEYEIEQIAAEIERYLQSHANAADTLEGITGWWLLQHRYINSRDCVHCALKILMDKGVVTRNISIDGKNIYTSSSAATFDVGDHPHYY